MTCSRMETDGMRYLDGEMSDSERVVFERHIEQCGECREVLKDLRKLQTLTGRIKMKDPTDEFWEDYWKSIYRRIERRTAWIFIIAGALMLIAYELYRSVLSFGKITFEKVALVLFVVGGILLIVSVVRERAHQYKTDRYKDVER